MLARCGRGIHTCILKAAVNKWVCCFFQPFETYLKMNRRFSADANVFTIQSGLSLLKQLLQTVLGR